MVPWWCKAYYYMDVIDRRGERTELKPLET